MYICLCKAITDSQIETAVAKGRQTLKTIGEFCGAGTDCGSCRPEIRSIIEGQRDEGKAFSVIDGGAKRKVG